MLTCVASAGKAYVSIYVSILWVAGPIPAGHAARGDLARVLLDADALPVHKLALRRVGHKVLAVRALRVGADGRLQ
jgi:hypothetical protein